MNEMPPGRGTEITSTFFNPNIAPLLRCVAISCSPIPSLCICLPLSWQERDTSGGATSVPSPVMTCTPGHPDMWQAVAGRSSASPKYNSQPQSNHRATLSSWTTTKRTCTRCCSDKGVVLAKGWGGGRFTTPVHFATHLNINDANTTPRWSYRVVPGF